MKPLRGIALAAACHAAYLAAAFGGGGAEGGSGVVGKLQVIGLSARLGIEMEGRAFAEACDGYWGVVVDLPVRVNPHGSKRRCGLV